VITLNILNFDESSAAALCAKPAERLGANFRSFLSEGGWAVLEIAPSQNAAEFAEMIVENFAPKAFLGNPYEFLTARLRERGARVTFAESCTGGLLASRVTAVSGASEIFDGSLVTYSDRLKTQWLKVSPDTLRGFGAVSEECAREMAVGALAVANSGFAAAISGIAGPDGGSAAKPVGTVFIAVADRAGAIFSERLLLKGDRLTIQSAAAAHALRLLLNAI
jgi:PncC family amidohydrolase